MSATSISVNRDRRTLAWLILCFVLSGFAGLVYQTAWTRQFALVFGTSEIAVATVLAAYMGGLALGAALIERWLPRVRRPVATYAALELGIAASALFWVPLLTRAGDALLQYAFGGQSVPPGSEQFSVTAFYLLSAFAALLLPTTLMGATLPLLARHAVHRDDQIGSRIGLLYTANTVGAVAGALTTAFALLPNLGLRGTTWAAAAINVGIFFAAAALSRSIAAEKSATPNIAELETAGARWTPLPGSAWVLPIMLLSGAVAFAHEVLWTRMLSHIVGSSIYAFAVMVASFLAGIALGGAAGSYLARSRERAATLLGAAQLLAGLWAIAAFYLLDSLIPDKAGLFGNGLVANSLLGFLLLLPLTVAIGLTYPLAVRVLTDRAQRAATASARVYAWNTLGAIVGALGAGFFLIPMLRYEGSVVVAATSSAILAGLSWALLGEGRWLRRTGAVAAALVVAVAVAAPKPAVPERLLRTSPLNVGAFGNILYYDVGRSADVVMLQQNGGLALRTNGLPEALMDSSGMSPRFSGEYWMSSLAVLAQSDARDMLIVGYGGGVVVEGAPPSVRNIDVIELEPKVMDANAATRGLRRRDPLSDPRLNVVINDARGALRLTNKRYDAIVSQPSHPWTAGASHLYTREFMQLARDHLHEDGVFVQWMNVAFLDEDLLKSLTGTLLKVFGHARIYRPDPNTLIFLASSKAFDVEQRLADKEALITQFAGHYGRLGINCVEDLIAALAVDDDGAVALAQGASLITDDDNRMATSSVFDGLGGASHGMSAEATGRALAAYDPLQRSDSWIYGPLRSRLAFDYIARRLAYFAVLDPSLLDRMQRMGQALGKSAETRYVEGLWRSLRGDRDAGRQLVRESLAAYPGSNLLRYSYLQSVEQDIIRGTAASDVMSEVAALPADIRAVFQAATAMSAGRFAAAAALEPSLSSARWTDAWMPSAALLRADCRSRVTNNDVKHRLGDEAIEMLDRLILVQASVPVYGLRARAALAADRPDVLLESVASLAQWLGTAVRSEDASTRTRAKESLAEFRGVLAANAGDPRVDRRRLTEVQASLDAAETVP